MTTALDADVIEITEGVHPPVFLEALGESRGAFAVSEMRRAQADEDAIVPAELEYREPAPELPPAVNHEEDGKVIVGEGTRWETAVVASEPGRPQSDIGDTLTRIDMAFDEEKKRKHRRHRRHGDHEADVSDPGSD